MHHHNQREISYTLHIITVWCIIVSHHQWCNSQIQYSRWYHIVRTHLYQKSVNQWYDMCIVEYGMVSALRGVVIQQGKVTVCTYFSLCCWYLHIVVMMMISMWWYCRARVPIITAHINLETVKVARITRAYFLIIYCQELLCHKIALYSSAHPFRGEIQHLHNNTSLHVAYNSKCHSRFSGQSIEKAISSL